MPEKNGKPTAESQPYAELVQEILGKLARERCVSVVGLSNSGKSTLMRSLASRACADYLSSQRGRPIYVVYVDCNRAVAMTAQAFHEIVLRSIIEALASNDHFNLRESIQDYHQTVTEADQPFHASLAFNLALTELCEEDDLPDLCLVLDEFDEIYTALDERALINMRALRDRFRERLLFVVATARSLPYAREREIEGEFAEMFARATYQMPPLTEGQARAALTRIYGSTLSGGEQDQCYEFSGGHLGLLVACAGALAELKSLGADITVNRIEQRAEPGAECLKIWGQLTDSERELLIELASDETSGLAGPQIRHLAGLGLIRAGQVFSPIFARYVQRRSRGPNVMQEGVYVDGDSGDVWVDGVRIPVLTDLEFRLMELLEERVDKLTDKYMIVTNVWGEDYLEDVDDARVEKLISRLRSKIEPDPSNPRYLITRRGRGYKLLSRPAGSGE